MPEESEEPTVTPPAARAEEETSKSKKDFSAAENIYIPFERFRQMAQSSIGLDFGKIVIKPIEARGVPWPGNL